MKPAKSTKPPKSRPAKSTGTAGPKSAEPRPEKFDQGKFDQGKEVRAIARERVGAVKPGQVIEDKKQRKKPKHKPPAGTWEQSEG